MSTPILGSYSFASVPDVNGTALVMGVNTPTIISNLFSNRPVAGNVGNVFVATDTLLMYRDNGTTWDLLSGNAGCISLYSGTTPRTIGTSIISASTTTPTIAQGSQLWSQVVTPKLLTSRFLINQSFMIDSSTSNQQITVALFKDTTCIYATGANIAINTRPQSVALHHVDTPGNLLTTTYSLRIGISSSATWYVNGSAGITYGGTGTSSWSITEIGV